MSSNQDKKQTKSPQNLVKGSSINLIPPQTEEEVKLETRKVSLNLNAALALLFLFLLTVGIIGFNLFSRTELNRKKQELITVENQIKARNDLLSANDEILRRVRLYNSIEQTTYSTKEVLDYWENISKDYGTITDITLTQGMNFVVNGTSESLKDVSKLWYVLGNDVKIESLDLRSVSKNEDGIRFNFDGRLNFKEFQKNARTE